MTWNVSGEHLWVCFNRDENRTRPRADAPRFHSENGHRIAFARDPLGGGSWLAVSDEGFVVALMNNYGMENNPDGSFLSRGKLVTLLAAQDSFLEASACLEKIDRCAKYPPFFLFLLSLREQIMWTWDGDALKARPNCPRFWTTSSFKTVEIGEWRHRQWKQRTAGKEPTLDQATQILRERTDDPARNMTMDRTDARTVSQTAIRMGKGCMELKYFERQFNGDAYEDPHVCRW